MRLAYIDHEDLLNQESSLELYLGELSDWQSKINQAELIVTSQIKNSGRKIRLLNTPFYFEDSSGNTKIETAAAFTSEKTDEDSVERGRFVIEVTVHSGSTLSVKVSGTNDDSSEVYETVAQIAVDRVGEYSARIIKPFKFYKLEVSASTTRTFKAFLIEDVFFLPVLFKAIALVYLDLKNEPDSNWESKFKDYEQLYNEAFESLLFSYDTNEDGSLQSNEINVPKRITLLR